MKLLSVLQNSYIARSPIRFQYAESETIDLEIFVSISKNNEILDAIITFKSIAQFKFVGIYFPEFFYGKYNILDEKDSGFFEILDFNFFDGDILGEESKLYLLYGYDCHIVIECLGYNILYI